MDNNPRPISYIIPVKNGAGFIESCLDQIASEMIEGDEIIVVDNGSTDNTVSLVRNGKHVKLLEYPELNIDGLRNRGAQVSSGNVLAFVDSDCLLQLGWRNAVVATAVGGMVEVVENGKSGRLVEAGNPPHLADTCIELIKNTDMRTKLGLAAAERVRSKFTSQNQYQCLVEIYLELMKQSKIST